MTIIWPNYDIVNPDPTTQAVTKKWLQVTVLGTPQTGLAGPDVFYFGNAPGESGNSAADARVNLSDVVLARTNQSGFGMVEIDNRYDFTRDRRVNLTDVILARSNQSGFTPLRLIDLTGLSPAASAPGPIDQAVLHDAAFADPTPLLPQSTDMRWLTGLDESGLTQRLSRPVDSARAAIEKLLATL